MIPIIALYFIGGTIFALSVGLRIYFKQAEYRYLSIENTQEEEAIPPPYSETQQPQPHTHLQSLPSLPPIYSD